MHNYFEPVLGPRFVIESQIVKERGRTVFVETRFHGAVRGRSSSRPGELLVFALTTMRRVALSRTLGDA